MTTLGQARVAKEKLKNLLSSNKWFKGVGIAYLDDDFIVKLNVSGVPTEARERLPTWICGVYVIVEDVGEIYALKEADDFIPSDG